jgi:hypothetical protein
MKSTLAFAIVLLVITSLSSCTSGWTEEIKADMTRTCNSGMTMSFSEEESNSICNCYIENLVKKYPTMEFTSAQNSEELETCSADARKRLQEEKSRLLDMEDASKLLNPDSLIKDSLTITPAQ